MYACNYVTAITAIEILAKSAMLELVKSVRSVATVRRIDLFGTWRFPIHGG